MKKIRVLILPVFVFILIMSGCGVKGDPTPAIDRIDNITEDTDSGSNSKK